LGDLTVGVPVLVALDSVVLVALEVGVVVNRGVPVGEDVEMISVGVTVSTGVSVAVSVGVSSSACDSALPAVRVCEDIPAALRSDANATGPAGAKRTMTRRICPRYFRTLEYLTLCPQPPCLRHEERQHRNDRK
jgi:hypothetical protein